MAMKCYLASILGVLLVFTPIIVAGQNIPVAGLFSFGDSNFDAGNKEYKRASVSPLPQKFWPYGKSRDDPNGKFSDGLIVTDFIAKFMKIPNEILPPVHKPGADIGRGATFAIAGASILGTPVDSYTLNQQVVDFRRSKSNWTVDFINQSVFMIYIGTEDYLEYNKNNRTADASGQQAFVTKVAARLKNDVGLLYSLGARKFVMYTLAPLGCLPIARQDFKTGLDQCDEILNGLARQHNQKIGPMMDEFAKTADGFQFTVFDFYNVILRRTQRNMNYRFSFTNESCCGVGTHKAYGCGMPNVHSTLCEYQRSYLFFDGRHNTEKAQESFAHLLFGADPNVIKPMNVRELVTYPVGDPMREYWSPTKSSDTVRENEATSYFLGHESY